MKVKQGQQAHCETWKQSFNRHPPCWLASLYYHLLNTSVRYACRDKSKRLMPKLAVLISTFQIECIIKFIILISLTPSAASTKRWRKTAGEPWWLQYVVIFNTDAQKKPPTLTALLCHCHQSAAVQPSQSPRLICTWQAGLCLLSLCFPGIGANRGAGVCVGPYVSYGARQAAVVSPQSVGPEASSAPLRCSATRAGPGPVWVGCLEERSRCRRRRCHWGSVGDKRQTVKRGRYPPQVIQYIHEMNCQRSPGNPAPVRWRPPSTVWGFF